MDASQEVWLLLRGFLALGLVLALALLVLRFGLPWLVRQRGGGLEPQLRVEHVCPLDRNHRLYVVRWRNEQILLATSAERVELVARAEAPSPKTPPEEAGVVRA